MASVVIVSGAVGAHATGTSKQAKVDHDGTAFWLFYLTSTNVLSTQRSTDYASWSAGATKTLTNAHNSEGRNQGVRIVNNGTVIAVHADIADRISSSSRSGYHLRGTIASSTLTWGTQTIVGANLTATDANVNYAGGLPLIDSAFKVYQSDNFNTTASQNFAASRFPNADTASSWTQGSATITSITTSSTETETTALYDLGSSNVLALGDNGAVFNAPTNIVWSKWNTSSWAPTSSNNVFSSSVTIDPNDWGSCNDGSNIHCIRRTAGTTYEHRIYSIAGNSWSNGASITTQASKAGAGLAMIYDPTGSKVYLFVIDSAAANHILYATYSGGAWSSWTTFEATSQTRNNLSVCPVIVSNAISLVWTEGSSPFNIVGEQLLLSTTRNLAANVTSGASVTSALTVKHPLATAATAGASVTAALTVKHPLAASVTDAATVSGLLVVKHPLAVAATSGASVTGKLTQQHKLTTAITAGASVTGALTVQHKLAAAVTDSTTVSGLLTWHHALFVAATAGASVSGLLSVSHPLVSAATAGASVSAALTVKHGIAASATAGASVSGALTVKHPLQASATAGASVSGLLTVTGGGASHALAAAATAGASVSAQLTVKHPLVASALSGASTTGLLIVTHPLAASALSGASVTGHAAVTRKLSAAATSGAAVTAALTIQHRLSATIASSTTALGILTWYHALFANVTSAATVSANPTVHLSAKVAQVGVFSASTTPAGGIGAGVVPGDSVARGILPAGDVSAAVVPSGTIERG